MRWTTVLLLGTIFAVVLAGVGIYLQTRAIVFIPVENIREAEAER